MASEPAWGQKGASGSGVDRSPSEEPFPSWSAVSARAREDLCLWPPGGPRASLDPSLLLHHASVRSGQAHMPLGSVRGAGVHTVGLEAGNPGDRPAQDVQMAENSKESLMCGGDSCTTPERGDWCILERTPLDTACAQEEGRDRNEAPPRLPLGPHWALQLCVEACRRMAHFLTRFLLSPLGDPDPGFPSRVPLVLGCVL